MARTLTYIILPFYLQTWTMAQFWSDGKSLGRNRVLKDLRIDDKGQGSIEKNNMDRSLRLGEYSDLSLARLNKLPK